MREEPTFNVTCSCGHQFVLEGTMFTALTEECDCCGVTVHLELTCPGCRKTNVLREGY